MENAVDFQKKVNRSVKWSFLGTFFSKIATPLATIILARILTPEMYGVTTAVTMVITFCEIVADSGFAKYLIHKDFESKEEYTKYFSVAIYSSLCFALIICCFVIIFANPISSLISNSGYEIVLIVATAQIPIYAVNAVFNADLRRNFKFKKIFICSLVSSLTPIFVTVPLAILGLGYWSLVIGSIATILFQTILFVFFSKQKVVFFYSLKYLKDMFMYSFAMLLEAVIIWLCTWMAVFLAGTFYNSYYVGLFKVSNTTVTSIFGILSFSINSVLFPSLSRIKSDDNQFRQVFLKLQKLAFFIVVPMGIGMFLFSGLITEIMLGDQWTDAASIIGLLGLSNIFKICYSYFLSESFRAKGNYFHSIIFQLITLSFQIVLLVSIGSKNFDLFVLGYFLSNVFYAIVAIAYLVSLYKFNIRYLIKPIIPCLISSLVMIFVALPVLFDHYSYLRQFCIALCCTISYFATMSIVSKQTLNDFTSFLLEK